MKHTAITTTKVILEFYMEIWYCYKDEGGSMADPLFTSTSYEMAEAEAKDAGYEVVQVIEFVDEEESYNQAPTLYRENKELKEALTAYVESVLHPDHVQKWYNQYKDDETANRVLVNAIATLNRY